MDKMQHFQQNQAKYFFRSHQNIKKKTIHYDPNMYMYHPGRDHGHQSMVW